MFRKIFISVFLLSFVLVYLLFNLYFSFVKTLGDEKYYLGDLAVDVYDYSLDQLEEKLDFSLFPFLDQADFMRIIEGVYTVSDVEYMINSTVDEIMSLSVDGDTIDFVFPLTIVDLKRDSILENFTNYIYTNSDFCLNDNDFDIETFACIPSTMSIEDLKLALEKSLDDFLFDNLLQDFKFTITLNNHFSGVFSDLLDKINALVLFTLGISLFTFLVLLTVFVLKPMKLILKWQGLALFIASFFSILCFYLLLVFSYKVFYLFALPPDILVLFEYLSESLFSRMFINGLILNVPILILGFVLFSVMRFKMKLKSEII